MLAENRVETLVVSLREPEDHVLEEREGSDVGDPEFAEEIVAAVKELLEDGDRGAHAFAEPRDARSIGLRLLLLVRDQVRRTLPEPVEPLQKDLHLGAARGLARVERRLRHLLLEPFED